jgi:hypothetical protein
MYWTDPQPLREQADKIISEALERCVLNNPPFSFVQLDPE